MSWTIILWVTLIQFFKDESLETIDRFFRLVRPNCLVFPRIVPTEG